MGMPLQSAAGAGTSEKQGELQIWAKRQQSLRGSVIVPIIAMHLLLPTTAALHHVVWHDLSGRLFGAVEVLTILSYQAFVAYLGKDDFASHAWSESNENVGVVGCTVHSSIAVAVVDERLGLGQRP